MKIEELHTQVMYALFAPDGSWQAMSLAPDFATCTAIVRMLHKAKLSKSLHELTMKGYKILPVVITMTQHGDENTAFSSHAQVVDGTEQPYTLANLLNNLNTLTPKQLAQPVRWIGESGQGEVKELWVLDENHIDPSGEGLEPVSNYLPKEDEDFDPATHMTTAELLAENTWSIGTAFVVID